MRDWWPGPSRLGGRLYHGRSPHPPHSGPLLLAFWTETERRGPQFRRRGRVKGGPCWIASPRPPTRLCRVHGPARGSLREDWDGDGIARRRGPAPVSCRGRRRPGSVPPRLAARHAPAPRQSRPARAPKPTPPQARPACRVATPRGPEAWASPTARAPGDAETGASGVSTRGRDARDPDTSGLLPGHASSPHLSLYGPTAPPPGGGPAEPTRPGGLSRNLPHCLTVTPVWETLRPLKPTRPDGGKGPPGGGWIS